MIKVKSKYLILIQILSTFFILISCSTIEEKEKSVNLTDTEIYNRAVVFLENKDYKNALNEFEILLLNYPFSSLTSKSEITSAYSLYQDNQIQKAINKLNNFIEMNPNGEFTSYAYYLLAMCYYVQTSERGRDPSLSLKALYYFQIINSKYPNTKYSKDANLKITYLKNRLAENELSVGKFYLRKNVTASAIKRFQIILEKYQNTSVIPETLYRLSEALLKTGLKDEANKSIAILNYNFPNNEWTKLAKYLLEDDKVNISKQGFTRGVLNYIKTILD